MYIILSRNGYDFASDGPDYVVLHHGIVIYRDMHKLRCEAEWRRLAA